jgi:hypothetical protein
VGLKLKNNIPLFTVTPLVLKYSKKLRSFYETEVA